MSQRALRRIQVPPTLLYVPANRPDRFAGAAMAAPGVLIDLEDSVPLPDKPGARAFLSRHLASEDVASGTWVRISSDPLDLEAIPRSAPIQGVMVAKARPEVLRRVAALRPELAIIALIEDAQALDHLTEMAQVDTVLTFAVGEVDLLADLRIRRTAETAGIVDALRLTIVRAAAAAGLHAPIGPTSLNVRDLGALESTTAHLRDLGFRGRTSIHPTQCPVIMRTFAPTEGEISQAHEIVKALKDSEGGVVLGPDGRMIDAAVVREAKEVLRRAPDAKEHHHDAT